MDACRRDLGAFHVGVSKRGAVVVTEVKLAKVALQMFLGNAVIDSEDATFENSEVTLDGIRISITSNVFLGAVVDGAMAGELFAGAPVNAAFVGSEM